MPCEILSLIIFSQKRRGIVLFGKMKMGNFFSKFINSQHHRILRQLQRQMCRKNKLKLKWKSHCWKQQKRAVLSYRLFIYYVCPLQKSFLLFANMLCLAWRHGEGKAKAMGHAPRNGKRRKIAPKCQILIPLKPSSQYLNFLSCGLTRAHK